MKWNEKKERKGKEDTIAFHVELVDGLSWSWLKQWLLLSIGARRSRVIIWKKNIALARSPGGVGPKIRQVQRAFHFCYQIIIISGNRQASRSCSLPFKRETTRHLKSKPPPRYANWTRRPGPISDDQENDGWMDKWWFLKFALDSCSVGLSIIRIVNRSSLQ